MGEYLVFYNGQFSKRELSEFAKIISLPKDIPISEYSNQIPNISIWSARLSTGIFGLADCKSGNRGPKGLNEVILAEGESGLNKLIDLGFITCPSCRPENTADWNKIKNTVKKKYGLEKLSDFADKKILNFDSRRVIWEIILPLINSVPSRLYLPKGLNENELITLKKRFNDIGFQLPPAGYYNPDSPSRFTEYSVPVI